MDPEADAARVRSALGTHGLLLLQDPVLPSVVTLLAGGPVRGSWWGHPLSHHIFRVLALLEEHADVASCKLVGGKVTYVHRALWPALLGVASSGERWQTQGLSRGARALMARVVTHDPVTASGPEVRELERRLLVYTEEVHTASGEHRTEVGTWSSWARRSGAPLGLPPQEARRELERAAAALGADLPRLPWIRPA